MRTFEAPGPIGRVARARAATFSVIIAAYQAADTIAEAVESALGQTMPPIEVIVCDDGSTDDLDRALAPYRSRIVVLRKENGGEASAKNAASRASSGDFVVILDADDSFLPERLEALSELASARPDLDILATDEFLEADGRVLRRAYTPEWTFEVDDQRQAILQRNFVLGHAAVRRERLLAVGGFDESFRYCTDWDCWRRLIFEGSRVGLVDEPLYLYRVHSGALSARRADMQRGRVGVIENALRDPRLSDRERDAAEGFLALAQRELRLLELRESLARRESDVRRRALAVLSDGTVSARTRLRAAVAVAAPGIAASLSRRRAPGATGAGGTPLESAAPRLRLAAYTDATTLGGAELSLATLLAGLPERFDVTVLGTTAEIVSAVAQRRPGAAACVLPPVESKRDVRAILAHMRALRLLSPQILHVSLNSPWRCKYGILAGLGTPGTRVVLVEQLPTTTDRRFNRILKRFTARYAAAHVAVGEQAAREIEHLAGLPLGRVRTIYNGRPDYDGVPVERVGGGVVVGSFGRLDDQKGYDVLVQALVSLPEVTAVLVGDGPERERLETLARDLGVAHRLVMTGWEDEPRRRLSSFDVFALPSRFEGFPLSIVEAMLASLPVVATDVGSVREAVVDGETGLLVPPDDAAALVTALGRLLDDPAERLRLGERGRARALERFTADAMVAAFETLYDGLLR